MRVKVAIFGLGACIPLTEYGANATSAGAIFFHMGGDKIKPGDFWHAYSFTSGPAISERKQTLVGSSIITEWFHVDTPSIYHYIGSLERWIGEVAISSPLILSRRCDVQFTAFNRSKLKIFDFQVADVKCMGIQLGSTSVRGTLVRNLAHSHPTIIRQLKTGTIGL